MNEQKKLQLSELCQSIDYGFTASASNEPCGPKFLRITDIVPGYINWSSVPFTAATLKEQAKYKLYDGDIVIARTGATTGASAYISNAPDAVFASYLVRLKIKPTTSSLFISYFLKSSFFWNHIRGVLGDKSAQPNASAKTMTSVTLSVPSLEEQKAIASVLGALDDKIENNRRMNETLEEMARAIFKSWFVDFDPVHAKAVGNAPAHMDAETAALFPSSFGDDGLPLGWCEEPLYNIATFINGAAYKNMHFCDPKDGLPVVKIIELKNGISAQTKFTNTDLGAKYKITSGEIFFAWSGSPQTSINTFIWPYGDGWLNQHIFAIKENGFANLAYLYFQMKVLNPKFVEIATDKQTTGLGHVTVRNMREMLVISPPDEIKRQFEQSAAPLFKKIKLNLSESQTLTELRDTLLPKLMSGEIRVKEAEREVEAAV